MVGLEKGPGLDANGLASSLITVLRAMYAVVQLLLV